MRLLLAAFLVVAIYQCSSPQEANEKTFRLTPGMNLYSHSGKVIKSIRVVEGNNIFIDFTDNTSMHLRSYKYPIYLVQHVKVTE